jgi:hypothetical protein
MTPSRRRALRTLASYVTLLVLVSLAAVPLGFTMGPRHQPLVLRLAAGLVLAVVLGHIRGAVGRALDTQPRSPLDRGAEPGRSEATIARQFDEILEDLRFGPASQSYWSRVVLPRLTALAERLPGRPLLVEPPRSGLRRFLGRGPSLAAITDVVAKLEEGA